ncbi:conserved hypothetical protein [Trichinella spiralis]|uniref:hypothetical protein n=1 Tax=Trichinella spiralis TaxID=6334 RepID=UPI0001EFE9CB|nr:conserved hypothetical protein [Trichinella spiralis]
MAAVMTNFNNWIIVLSDKLNIPYQLFDRSATGLPVDHWARLRGPLPGRPAFSLRKGRGGGRRSDAVPLSGRVHSVPSAFVRRARPSPQADGSGPSRRVRRRKGVGRRGRGRGIPMRFVRPDLSRVLFPVGVGARRRSGAAFGPTLRTDGAKVQ